jgi:DNA-binding transcriptional ArsR family regulator
MCGYSLSVSGFSWLCYRYMNSLSSGKKIMEIKLIEKEEDLIVTAASIKAMSHPLRLKILCALAKSELSVQDIVAQVGSTQSNISQHLAILRYKNLLATHKDANRVFYRISDTRTLKLVSMVRDVFCTV